MLLTYLNCTLHFITSYFSTLQSSLRVSIICTLNSSIWSIAQFDPQNSSCLSRVSRLRKEVRMCASSKWSLDGFNSCQSLRNVVTISSDMSGFSVSALSLTKRALMIRQNLSVVCSIVAVLSKL